MDEAGQGGADAGLVDVDEAADPKVTLLRAGVREEEEEGKGNRRQHNIFMITRKRSMGRVILTVFTL